ncbi:NAC domain-containing protein 71 isoform X1 [Brassica rapa]|uniref:NAC domain-containing protein 71 isoform X1 n=2 Tax=Brassica campestris TaxID=3711 RepID=UPI0004F1C5CE|nr:NAC domain-containing protein 71 isoform X1 [Brassica rapa]
MLFHDRKAAWIHGTRGRNLKAEECRAEKYRFHPTDEELVGYYLHRRNEGLQIELEIIPLMDLYKFDPWELPEKSFLPNRDMEWFFFCHRDRKYQNGSRINRATKSGYWKATGKDRKIVCQSSSSSSTSSIIGCRKTLVFYLGRAPFGGRTEWAMHEYRLFDNDTSQGSLNFKGDFALCRVVKRNHEVTLKKCETSSLEVPVPGEPQTNNVDIPCEARYIGKGSCDTSNTLRASPDFILGSSTKGHSQSQTEDDSGFQEFSLPEIGYPPEFFADLNFDWGMENSFPFVQYQEAHVNNEVINYDVLR